MGNSARSGRCIHRGRIFDLREEPFRLPNGRTVRYDVIRHPGAVAIVPILPDGRLLLIRQLRPAIGKSILEIPAGTREPGERPDTTARRELREETGWRPRKMKKMLEFYSAPGFCTEKLVLYLATDLVRDPLPGDADEDIRPVPCTLKEAHRMIETGRIRDAKTIIGIQAIGGRLS